MQKNFLISASLLILTACTTNPKVGAMTQPATVINTKKPSQIIYKLNELCDRRSMQIESSSDTSVTCSERSSTMARMLFSTKYGTEVRTTYKFNVFPVGDGGVRVVANIAVGNQTAFGQNHSYDFTTGTEMSRTAQAMLDQAKNEIERK